MIKAPYHFKASGQTTLEYIKCSRVAFKYKKRQLRVKEQQRRIYVNERKDPCVGGWICA